MKNLSKNLILVGVIIFGLFFGMTIRKAYFPTPKKVEVLNDTLPLENQGNMELQLIGNKRIINISFDDFSYVIQKRKRSKETLKNIDSLFKRLED